MHVQNDSWMKYVWNMTEDVSDHSLPYMFHVIIASPSVRFWATLLLLLKWFSEISLWLVDWCVIWMKSEPFWNFSYKAYLCRNFSRGIHIFWPTNKLPSATVFFSSSLYFFLITSKTKNYKHWKAFPLSFFSSSPFFIYAIFQIPPCFSIQTKNFPTDREGGGWTEYIPLNISWNICKYCSWSREYTSNGCVWDLFCLLCPSVRSSVRGYCCVTVRCCAPFLFSSEHLFNCLTMG